MTILRFNVPGSGFKVEGILPYFRVQCSGFKVEGILPYFRVYFSGFRFPVIRDLFGLGECMNNILKLIIICSLFMAASSMFYPKYALAITAKQEEELAREFMKVALNNYQLIKDPLIVDYVNRVGKKIVSVIPSPPFAYRFYVIKQDAFNAFAGPAGNIFINSGLLESMENEEELAGIIGHEISHVVCRHISDMIEKSKKIEIATIAGIAAGIFLGITGAGSAASSAITYGSIAAGQTAVLAYSRENEMQADQIGLKYLEKAGYSADGLLTILKKIRNRTWFGSDQIPTYLVTHPATKDRIAYIGAWMETNKKAEKEIPQKENYSFKRMHYRLSAYYGDKSLALKKIEASVKKHPDDALAHYGYGLILARIGNRKDAITHLKIALEKNPFEKTILNDLGKIYFLDGQYQNAMNLLVSNKSIPYYDPEGKLFLGRAQEKLGRTSDAISTLEKLIAIRPDYVSAYFYLGQIYDEQGQYGNAHYYLGFYYSHKKELQNAMFHLKTALKHIQDPVKKKNAEEMLKKMKKRPVRKMVSRDKREPKFNFDQNGKTAW